MWPGIFVGVGTVQRYEYTVAQLREGMISGKMSADKLRGVLNDHAKEGGRKRVGESDMPWRRRCRRLGRSTLTTTNPWARSQRASRRPKTRPR